MPDASIRMSRSGFSNPEGKLDTELKTVVPEMMHDEFNAIATLQGKTKAELLREVVTVYIHGHLGMYRMLATGGRREGRESGRDQG